MLRVGNRLRLFVFLLLRRNILTANTAQNYATPSSPQPGIAGQSGRGASVVSGKRIGALTHTQPECTHPHIHTPTHTVGVAWLFGVRPTGHLPAYNDPYTFCFLTLACESVCGVFYSQQSQAANCRTVCVCPSVRLCTIRVSSDVRDNHWL